MLSASGKTVDGETLSTEIKSTSQLVFTRQDIIIELATKLRAMNASSSWWKRVKHFIWPQAARNTNREDEAVCWSFFDKVVTEVIADCASPNSDNIEDSKSKVTVIHEFIDECINEGLIFNLSNQHEDKELFGRFKKDFILITVFLVRRMVDLHNIQQRGTISEEENLVSGLGRDLKDLFSYFKEKDITKIVSNRDIRKKQNRLIEKAIRQSSLTQWIQKGLIYGFSAIVVLVVSVVIFAILAAVLGGAAFQLTTLITQIAMTCFAIASTIGGYLFAPYIYSIIQHYGFGKSNLQYATESLSNSTHCYIQKLIKNLPQIQELPYKKSEILNQGEIINKINSQLLAMYSLKKDSGNVKIIEKCFEENSKGTWSIIKLFFSCYETTILVDENDINQVIDFYNLYVQPLQVILNQVEGGESSIFFKEKYKNYYATIGACLINNRIKKNHPSFHLQRDKLREIARKMTALCEELSLTLGLRKDSNISQDLYELTKLAEEVVEKTKTRWLIENFLLTMLILLVMAAVLFFIAASVGWLFAPMGTIFFSKVGFLSGCVKGTAFIHSTINHGSLCYSAASTLAGAGSTAVYEKFLLWNPQSELQNAIHNLKNDVEIDLDRMEGKAPAMPAKKSKKSNENNEESKDIQEKEYIHKR